MTVKTYDSTQAGAPVLSGTAGAMRAVVKACAIDGFGAGAVSTLVVAGEVATATYATAHPFRIGSVALYAGATPAGLNGEKTILTTTTYTVTFAAPGIADGAATGTITSKMAALGWTELFPSALANVIALKPTVPEATGCVMRIDDTGTTNARVVVYESMSDISTGLGATPTEVQLSGGAYWPKSEAANGAARRWVLWGDGQSLVLYIAPNGSQQQHGVVMGFGDLLSDKSGDAYGCAVTDAGPAGHFASAAILGCLGYGHGVSAASNLYVVRSYTGLGGAAIGKKVSAHNTAANYSGRTGYNGNTLPYPNGADNSLRLAPLEVLVGASGFRGRVAGVYHSPQVCADAFASGDKVPGDGAFAGRTMMAVRTGMTDGSLSAAGVLFVDLTGWRS